MPATMQTCLKDCTIGMPECTDELVTHNTPDLLRYYRRMNMNDRSKTPFPSQMRFVEIDNPNSDFGDPIDRIWFLAAHAFVGYSLQNVMLCRVYGLGNSLSIHFIFHVSVTCY